MGQWRRERRTFHAGGEGHSMRKTVHSWVYFETCGKKNLCLGRLTVFKVHMSPFITQGALWTLTNFWEKKTTHTQPFGHLFPLCLETPPCQSHFTIMKKILWTGGWCFKIQAELLVSFGEANRSGDDCIKKFFTVSKQGDAQGQLEIGKLKDTKGGKRLHCPFCGQGKPLQDGLVWILKEDSGCRSCLVLTIWPREIRMVSLSVRVQ